MKAERQITAFGETKSITAWSQDSRCKVTYGVLVNRLRSGWPSDQAISLESYRVRKAKDSLVNAFGQSKSLKDWELDERAFAPAPVILYRLQRGWPTERAISEPYVSQREPKEAKPKKVIVAFGEEKTLSDWLKDSRCVVSRPTLLRNLLDMDPERAMVTKRSPARRQTVESERRSTISYDEAVRYLDAGADLWASSAGDGLRVTLSQGSAAFAVDDASFERLLSEHKIVIQSKIGGLTEYRGSRS